MMPALAQVPRALTAADYARAEQFMPYNADQLVLYTADTPTWLPSGKLWYRTDGKGLHVLLVDPVRDNEEKVSLSLLRPERKQYEAGDLPFDTFDLSADGKSVSFQVGSKRSVPWAGARCLALPALNPNGAAFSR